MSRLIFQKEHKKALLTRPDKATKQEAAYLKRHMENVKIGLEDVESKTTNSIKVGIKFTHLTSWYYEIIDNYLQVGYTIHGIHFYSDGWLFVYWYNLRQENICSRFILIIIYFL